MPWIQLKLKEEVLMPAEKSQIVVKLIDAMVPIERGNIRPVTWLTIEEICSGEWRIGGSADRP
jgi:phenylpyruvate tautomerase PptA (4-oxalocrotonate tautomerase family)